MIFKPLRSIEKLLKKVYNFIVSGPSKEAYITDSSSFSRNRVLTFPVVVSTILNLFKESVEYNLSLVLPFFNTASSVTGAAFSLARFKIHISFFKDLNKLLVDFHHGTHTKLWKGFQLLAADGSTVSLPASKQMKDYFGVHSCNNHGVKNCLAQALMIFDVFTDFVIAGRLSKMENSERTLLDECLETLPQSKSILLLDRGFGDFSTLKRLLKYKKDFCVRISGSSSLFGQRAIEIVETDVITDWRPSKKEKATCCKHNLDYEPIKVRVTRVTLANGEVELLVSSLCNLKLYSSKDITTLYELRWGIEEGYKN